MHNTISNSKMWNGSTTSNSDISYYYMPFLENDSIQFKLITDQLPNKEFIKYVQIDHLTNTIFIGTDNCSRVII